MARGLPFVTKLSLCIVLLILLSAAESATHDEPLRLSTERREVRLSVNDFTLVDQNARRFEFKSLSNKIVVISFAYTSCTDVCPLLTAAVRQVQSRLRAMERDNVYLLTITTEPEIDSPEIFAAYAKRYGAEFSNWSFLTGKVVELQQVWKNFGVQVNRRGRGIVEHTPLTVIVDRHKRMRYVYIGPSPDPNAVLADVDVLLNER